ncbi:MAG: UDP-N-acetylglucosamine 2-epimerase (non-hydrolyzing), partial [Candidatus Omnitrophica bacterium]|nr:UDP-N-acetylglucosamine 2-epimerase (non-hydrolyzing) [Candidatus Omnitrophota bacterium]
MTIEEFAKLHFPNRQPLGLVKESVEVKNWRVLSVDDNGLACFKKVKSIIRHKVDKKIFSIKTSESEVSVTEDHSLCTLRGDKILQDTPLNLKNHLLVRKIPPIKMRRKVLLLKETLKYPEYWRNLFLYIPKDIEIDEKILSNSRDYYENYLANYNRVAISNAFLLNLDLKVLSRCFISNNYLSYGYKIKPHLEISEQLCWILGFYLAEGSIIKEKNEILKVFMYNQNMGILEKMKDDLEKIFNVKLPEPRYYESAKCGRLILPLVFAYILIEIFDIGMCEEKKVPYIIYHLPLRFKEKFLEGYMVGDAYLKEGEINTKSKKLFDSLIFLLRTMGITYTIKFNRYKDKRRNIYALKILKSGRHGHSKLGKTYSERPFKDVKNMEIKEVKFVKNHSLVYDLSVEDTERFITAHGVVLHNTNTVLAGALASVKIRIPIGHVEAGLRSFDRNMPEEINRILADHVSDLLFAPTEKAKQNLLKEGISNEKIFVTGNTIVDAVYQNLILAKNNANILDTLEVKEKSYFLVTIHRQENVDNMNKFKGILDGLKLVQKYFDMPIIYPIHPRAKRRMKEFKLNANGLIMIDPVDYLTFLKLESNAKLIFTDSGGVQEEACILKVPCVTLRYNTERPETIEV